MGIPWEAFIPGIIAFGIPFFGAPLLVGTQFNLWHNRRHIYRFNNPSQLRLQKREWDILDAVTARNTKERLDYYGLHWKYLYRGRFPNRPGQ